MTAFGQQHGGGLRLAVPVAADVAVALVDVAYVFHGGDADDLAAVDADFMRFGAPRLAFLVNGGNIDSMVAHYTAAKKKRSDDAYSPGNKAGLRPDRAVTVYSRLIREKYENIIAIYCSY